jgi:hypothetical protein
MKVVAYFKILIIHCTSNTSDVSGRVLANVSVFFPQTFERYVSHDTVVIKLPSCVVEQRRREGGRG